MKIGTKRKAKWSSRYGRYVPLREEVRTLKNGEEISATFSTIEEMLSARSSILAALRTSPGRYTTKRSGLTVTFKREDS